MLAVTPVRRSRGRWRWERGRGWAGARRREGWLTLDEICEIAALSDAQLDAASMAEGARDCWGLIEWGLARHPWLRRHLRFLAGLSTDQRREAQDSAGLSFTKLS